MTTDLNDLRAQVAAIRATQISTARGSGANDASRPPQGANPSSARQNNAGRGRGGSSVGAGGQPPGPARSQQAPHAPHELRCLNPDIGQWPRGDKRYYRNKMRATKDRNGNAMIRLYDTDIVVVRCDGAVKLSVGGSFFTQTTLLGMNDVLKAINFKVKAVNVNDGRTWSVVHPNGSLPFSDNMVIGAVDPIVDASRVHAVLNAAQECSISCFECVTPASNWPAPSQHLSQDPIQDQPNKKNINPAASAAQPSIAQPSSSAQALKPPPTLMRALLNSVQQAGPAHALASHASPPLSTLSTPTRAPVTAHSTDHQSCNAPVASSQISASDDDLCVICYTDKKEMVAIPCGHVILCTSCSENEKLMKDMKNVCPICRSKIDCVVFIG